MGPPLLCNGWSTLGPNTDAQERRGLTEQYFVEELCFLGTLEVLERHSAYEAFCKSRLMQFLVSEN